MVDLGSRVMLAASELLRKCYEEGLKSGDPFAHRIITQGSLTPFIAILSAYLQSDAVQMCNMREE
jgi:hypothetical protein